MFGLGFTELLILALIAFLVFGPQQFPLVAKNFIKLLNELRRAFTDVKTEFSDIETEVQNQVQQITEGVTENLNLKKEARKENLSQATQNLEEEKKKN